jgi:ribonuclease T2
LGRLRGGPAVPRFRGNRSYIGAESAGGKRQCVSGILLAGPSCAFACCPRPPGRWGARRRFRLLRPALSWTPTWCALEGDDRNSPQCDRGRGSASRSTGSGRNTRTAGQASAHGPAPALAGADRRHGGHHGLFGTRMAPVAQARCLQRPDVRGLLRAVAAAYERVVRPDLLRRLDREVRLPARVIEEAFLEANPDLEPDMLTVTCRAGRVQEVRLCLTRRWSPGSAAMTWCATARWKAPSSARCAEPAGRAVKVFPGKMKGGIPCFIFPKNTHGTARRRSGCRGGKSGAEDEIDVRGHGRGLGQRAEGFSSASKIGV